MKILIFSPVGDGIGLAHQLVAEGHQVAIHFDHEDDARQGAGMLWVSDDWQNDARQADFVLFDNNGHGSKADLLRSRGVKVWGGGSFADKLEMDRKFGMAVMRKAGIPIPPTWDFHNYAEAHKIIESEFEDDEQPVVKLNDNAGCATSYVGRSKEDVLLTLESWENEHSVNLGKGGIVQKKIDGAEISVEGWFNGESFMYPFNVTMEDKKLLTGNLGPNVGCAFSWVRQIRSRRPRIARLFLEPLVPLLKKAGYQGQIDVNMIVDAAGKPYALEFTPRPGYEGTSNLALGLDGGYGEAVSRSLGLSGQRDAIAGGSASAWGHLVALRTWIPPYPMEAKGEPTLMKGVYDCVHGVPVTSIPDISRFIPYDIGKNEETGDLEIAGTCGVPGIAVANGKTLESAVRSVYETVEEVEIPNLGYRTDGGARVRKELPRLESSGLLTA